MTTVFILSGTTMTVPSDWNSASNTVETVGGGGGACGGLVGVSYGGGGGGGAYSKIVNLTLTPLASVNVGVGTGGAGSTGGVWVRGRRHARGGGARLRQQQLHVQ